MKIPRTRKQVTHVTKPTTTFNILPSREQAAQDWLCQYDGDRLDNLARTVADRIFLCFYHTWYGEEDIGTQKDAERLVKEAVERCNHLGIRTNRAQAQDVLDMWGTRSPTPPLSDNDE